MTYRLVVESDLGCLNDSQQFILFSDAYLNSAYRLGMSLRKYPEGVYQPKLTVFPWKQYVSHSLVPLKIKLLRVLTIRNSSKLQTAHPFPVLASCSAPCVEQNSYSLRAFPSSPEVPQ
jgi:hypothetical protein